LTPPPGTPPLASKAEVLRSLGRLVRGLSALFWGLPLALVISVQTAKTRWFEALGCLPALLANALLLFGLWQLGHFQRRERPWVKTLERAKVLSIVNVGLSPFLFWWNILPRVTYYNLAILLFALSGLLLLFNLNLVLQRLTAMLPDEALRQETRLFTNLNLYILTGIVAVAALYTGLGAWEKLPPTLAVLLALLEPSRPWLVLLLVLLPVAMTMALIWKIKEVVLQSVFEAEG
jgi:hypothetical protein